MPDELRSNVLAGIRQSLGRDALSEPQMEALRDRFRNPEAGIRPHFDKDPVAQFVEKLTAASGTVARVKDAQGVPGAIDDYLREHGLPADLVMARNALLDRMDWPQAWAIHKGPAAGDDRVSVTGAYAAVAEVGGIVMLSGPDSPTTLNFLPENHIVVLESAQVVAHMEDVWWLIQKNRETMPRTVNFITGPSRTADVEQTIQLGAHGPRRLHVVLLDG